MLHMVMSLTCKFAQCAVGSSVTIIKVSVSSLRASSSVTPKFCKISWMICIAWRSLLSFSQCKDIGPVCQILSKA